jgi:hypothetical protein
MEKRGDDRRYDQQSQLASPCRPCPFIRFAYSRGDALVNNFHRQPFDNGLNSQAASPNGY